MWWIRSSFFWSSGRAAFIMRFLPLIFVEQNLSDSQIGIILSSSYFSLCVLVPIITGIADFKSNRFVILIIVCIVSAFISLLFLLPFYWFNITNTHLIFYWSLFIMILYSIPENNVFPCINGLCLMIISNNKQKYGPLKSFGSLAWGLGHILVGILLEFNIIKLHDCIYLYILSTIPLIISVYFAFGKINYAESTEIDIDLIDIKLTKIEDNIDATDENYGSMEKEAVSSSSIDVNESSKLQTYFNTLKYIFSKPYTAGIFIVAAMFGGGWVTVQSLLFVYIMQLNENKDNDAYLLMGLSAGIGAIIEVPLMYCSKWCVNHLGYRNMIFIGLICYILRLIGYTLLTSNNLWFLLIIEMMQGVTFALIYVAVVTLTSIIFPKHLGVTAQGLLTAIINGISPFIFVFAAGYIMQYMGAIWLYRILAIMVFITLISFYLLSKTLNKFIHEKEHNINISTDILT